MKIKVKALDTYEKNNITDIELGRIPKEGEIFEVNLERFEILTGNNKYKKTFVEKSEKQTIKNTKKKTTKLATKKVITKKVTKK